jgi:hypothetical protein
VKALGCYITEIIHFGLNKIYSVKDLGSGGSARAADTYGSGKKYIRGIQKWSAAVA